jgi:TolB-like protein
MLGETISHYRILEKLGQGGMGEVYLAEDTRLQRNVALKFLAPELSKDRDVLARFRNEARAAAELSHPNIAAIFAFEEIDEHGFLVLEYIEGETLHARLTRGPISVEEVQRIGAALCEGLAHAHARGVVHRDVKSANVMLTSDGGVKILDFGLARRTDATQITRRATVMGTVSYMSPEQARAEPVDERSDVWSLGVLLHEMLAGHRPFRGHDDQAILYSIFNTDPEDLSGFVADVSEELSGIVSRALAKDIEQRYQRVTDLAHDLASTTDPTASATLVSASSTRHFRGASPRLALIAVVVVVAAVVTRFVMNETPSAPDRTMIAVMPFEMIGPQEQKYVADGISDAILTRLSAIRELGVISRQSTQTIDVARAGIPDIGRALSAAYVLQGTVQLTDPGSAEGSIVVRPRLMRASDGVVEWSDTYDQPMSEMLRVQASIAETVARSLDLRLVASEREALAAIYTENLVAYDHFLKGESLRYSQGYDAQLAATEQYSLAVQEDPEFLEAWCMQARQEVRLYYNWGKVDGLKRADAAVARAMQLDAEHAATKSALADVAYYGRRDFDGALEVYEQIREVQPSNSHNLMRCSLIQRRLSRWDEAVANLEAALELDPRNPALMGIISKNFRMMRKFPQGLTWIDRLRSIEPLSGGSGYETRAMLLLGNDGSLDRARSTMLEAAEMIPPEGWEGGTASVRLKLIRIFPELYDRFYPPLDPDQTRLRLRGEQAIFRAELERAMGRHDRARAYSDTIRSVFTRHAPEIPDDLWPPLGKMISSANLGRREEAIHWRDSLLLSHPPEKDSFGGMGLLCHIVESSVKIGDTEFALDGLETLLSAPSNYFAAQLEHDPLWDPLRDHPRFQELLENARRAERALR